MKTIDGLIEDIINTEGGYTNDPNDSGGETNYGITVAVARHFGYVDDMRHLPRMTAKAIYLRKYVIAPGFDAVTLRSHLIAAELVDTGVNLGQPTAARFLHRALNAFNRGGTDYADIPEDTKINANTLVALDAYLNKRGSEGVTVMCRALNSMQGMYYIELVERRPKDEKYTYGWFLNRVVI
jgi:lysozyme family protein